MNRTILMAAAVAMAVVGCGTPAGSGDACVADNECKGDRICVSGDCVDPASGNAQSSGGSSDSSGSSSSSSDAPAAGSFGAACEESSECDQDLCVFHSGRGGRGFCSAWCDAVSECPTNYDCVNINNAARKSCVPEDRLGGCTAACSEYGFFQCVDTSVVSDCQLACEGATVQERLSFIDCAGSETLECSGTSCIERLGVEMVEQASDCRDDAEATGFCGGARGLLCANDGRPDDQSCNFMGIEGDDALYCCR